MPPYLIDSFGRKIDYLRLSVTDRCNLRCAYCLPPEGYAFRDSKELLTDEEILRLARLMAKTGISKVRVTGGEPLTRPSIVKLMERLVLIPGIEDVSLSTNGVLFANMARALWEAGLRRVNISLDTLKPDKFKQITRFGDVNDVFLALRRAVTLGFDPVKVNVVVMRGINDDEIEDFVALTKVLPLHVRFIELMPIGETGFFSKETWIPLEEIRGRCGELEALEADQQPRGWGPAVYFRTPGALGTIGFIGALGCNFCQRCNRLRMTSSGKLQPCLASSIGIDLGSALRSGASDGELEPLVYKTLEIKPERHHMEEGAVREAFMCSLGG